MRFVNIYTILIGLSMASSNLAAAQMGSSARINPRPAPAQLDDQRADTDFKQAKPYISLRRPVGMDAYLAQKGAENTEPEANVRAPRENMSPTNDADFANPRPLPLRIFHPLVAVKEDGEFEVNPRMHAVLPDIKKMTKAVYLMRKNDPVWAEMRAEFEGRGWKIFPFIGRSGKRFDVGDMPGMVAYNNRQNVMIISFRGSDNTGKTGQRPTDKKVRFFGFKSADWQVNMDARIIDTPLGKMHRGYYQKVVYSMPHIAKIIHRIFSELSPQQKATMQIFFTGHSQGAALATIASEMIAEDLKAPGLLGPTFDNLKTNTIQLLIFSAPRVLGDEQALQNFNNIIGKQNAIRQNVVGRLASDPVPVGSPGKTMTSVLKAIPIAGQGLAKKYAGGSGVGAGVRSVGYLAGDKASDVYARIARLEAKAYVSTNLRDLQDVRSPQDLKDTAKVVGYRGAAALVAPLHYGGINHQSSIEKGSALTSLDLLESAPPLEQLLRQGYEHQLQANSGWRGKARRGIEAVANKKVAFENKVTGFFRRSKGAPESQPANIEDSLRQNELE